MQLDTTAPPKFSPNPGWRRARSIRDSRPVFSDVQVEFLVRVPAETPAHAPIYISGNHPLLGNWRADGMRLTPIGFREYHGSVQLPANINLEFKVTRGTWESVEQSREVQTCANRRLHPESGTLQFITVDQWADSALGMPKTHASQQQLHDHDGFASSILASQRSFTVYLPPGYETDLARRYPVLYMQDGQNLFDAAASFAGADWRIAETADRLIALGTIEPLIIVGIHNSADRLNEYAPIYDASENAGGGADRYVDFIAREVKSFIADRYRTMRGREHTGIAGSSLGAIASLHACKHSPHVFSRCAAMSPSLWWGRHRMVEHFIRDAAWLDGLRLWIDMGDTESCGRADTDFHAIAEARRFARTLRDRSGASAFELHYEEIANGTHHESAWASRFDRVLQFLFPPRDANKTM